MAGFREKIVEGVILKKQALGEADELITIYTQQAGKLRVVAKSSKLAKSKLQSQLQPVFTVQLTMAGSGPLPKVIGATATNTHRQIYESLEKMQVWYVASELVMRATPDEEVNEELYQLLSEFLEGLERTHEADIQFLILLSFKIRLLHAIGVSVQPPSDHKITNYFSNEFGGFLSGVKTTDGVVVSSPAVVLFKELESRKLAQAGDSTIDPQELNTIITQYIIYQLEREIRSEKFVSSSR